MRPRGIHRGAGGAMLGGILVACNALTGAGDLGVRETTNVGDEGGTRDGQAPLDEAGNPILNDGSTGGGDSAIPVIAPSLASCGTERLCMTDTGGWSPAIYVTVSIGGTCPPEWPNAKTYQASGGGSCGCTCTPNGSGSACVGVSARTGAACGGNAAPLPVTNGNCTNVGVAPLSPIALVDTGTPPASCSGAVTSNLDEPEEALTCSGAVPTTSSACKAGEVCVPKAPPFLGLPSGATCMVHDGDAPCPTNLPVRHVVGSAVMDNRSCSATCACAPVATCAGAKVEVSTNAACTAGTRTYQVDGTCSTAAPPTGTYYKYTAGKACTVTTPPTVMGTETVADPRTFCCTIGF